MLDASVAQLVERVTCNHQVGGSNPPRGLKFFVQSPFYKDYYNQQNSIFYVSNTFQITLCQSRFCFGTELYVSNNLLLPAEFSCVRCWRNLFETFSPTPKQGFFALMFQITLALRRKQRFSGSGKRRTKRKKRENQGCELFTAGISEPPLLFLFLKEVKAK